MVDSAYIGAALNVQRSLGSDPILEKRMLIRTDFVAYSYRMRNYAVAADGGDLHDVRLARLDCDLPCKRLSARRL